MIYAEKRFSSSRLYSKMFANLTPDVADCDGFRKMSVISDATMIRTLEGSKVLPTF